MKLFENTYNALIRFSKLKSASWYLAILSFVESFILPFPPPDMMLAPMAIARPEKAFFLAGITLTASVCGGIVGYLIGAFSFDEVQSLLIEWGYQPVFDKVTLWYNQWGFWAVLIAGFSPIPYKIFTLSAGALGLAFIPFLLASLIGRGARFFLVAWCLATFGSAIEYKLMHYIERIGWVIVIILIISIKIY